MANSFYPPPPNLISDPPDDPEWHIFYTIRTGIRYTGMPAWDKTLTEQDMWKITMLLSHLDKLPPAVQDYWKTSFGAAPAAADEKKEKECKEKHDASLSREAECTWRSRSGIAGQRQRSQHRGTAASTVG